MWPVGFHGCASPCDLERERLKGSGVLTLLLSSPRASIKGLPAIDDGTSIKGLPAIDDCPCASIKGLPAIDACASIKGLPAIDVCVRLCGVGDLCDGIALLACVGLAVLPAL